MRTERTDRRFRPIHGTSRRRENTVGAGAAQRVAGAIGAFLEGPIPVRIRAWDGSEAGAAPGAGVPTVVLRSRRALRRLLWEPGERAWRTRTCPVTSTSTATSPTASRRCGP